jgi:hypothetical protein
MRRSIFGIAMRKVSTLASLRTAVVLGHGVGEVRAADFRRVRRPMAQVLMVRLRVVVRRQAVGVLAEDITRWTKRAFYVVLKRPMRPA